MPDFNSYKHSIECFCRKSSCIYVLFPKLAINSPATWQSREQPTKTTALCERDCWAKPPSPGGETAITVKPSIRRNHPYVGNYFRRAETMHDQSLRRPSGGDAPLANQRAPPPFGRRRSPPGDGIPVMQPPPAPIIFRASTNEKTAVTVFCACCVSILDKFNCNNNLFCKSSGLAVYHCMWDYLVLTRRWGQLQQQQSNTSYNSCLLYTSPSPRD